MKPVTYIMKKITLINIAITILFRVANLFAGGFFVSDTSMELHQPDQKAVITWDGEKETILLSTGLRSDDIANFVWIVPVISSRGPLVNYTGMQAHADLAVKFWGRRKSPVRQAGIFGKRIEDTVKIDRYDMSILDAGKPEDLLKWLEENGYRISGNTVKLIDNYMDDKNVYFIMNRLDLRDMFREEIEEVENIYDNVKNEYSSILSEIREIFSNETFMDKRYRGRNLETVIINYLKTWSPKKVREKPGFYWLEDYYNKIIRKEFKEREILSKVTFLLNEETLRIEGNPVFNMTISDEGLKLNISYDFDIMKYSWRKGTFSIDGYSIEDNLIYVNNQDLEKYRESINTFGRIRGLNESDIDVLMEFFSLGDFDYSGFIRQLDERVVIVENNVMQDAMKMAEDYLPALVELFDRIEEYNRKPQIYVKKFYDEKYDAPLAEKVDSLVNSSSVSIEAKKKFSELADMIGGLKKGINSPLRIEFYPDSPVYPLGLAPVNSGECRVEVFFISDNHVYDKKEILWKDKKVISLNAEKEEIQLKNLDISDMRYMSWFSQVGYLREYGRDVVFKMGGE